MDLYILGDFSAVFNRKVGRKSNKKAKKGGILLRIFLEMLEERSLINVCRLQYPPNKAYTFYSQRHNSWSSLDMCWVSAEWTEGMIDPPKYFCRS